MRARAILIGWDGGLVESAGTRFRVLREVLAEEGIEPEPEVLAAHPCAPPFEAWLAAVIRSVCGDVPGSLPARLMVRASARYREGLRREGPAWRAGALEFVRAAARAGIDLGVVGTAPRREVDEALARAEVERCFRIVVGAEDLAGPDAGSSPHRVAMSRLNSRPPLPERLIHPHEVVAIEGTAEGLRAAAAAGLSTVALGPETAPVEAGTRVAGFESLDPATLRSG